MKKNSKNEWFVFNREYVPLGWNSIGDQENNTIDDAYSNIPVHTRYKRLTDNAISKIIKDEGAIRRDNESNIKTVFFYNDATNPRTTPKYWNRYFEIIKALSKFDIEKK